MFAGVGQQGNVTRPFNGYRHAALVLGAHSGFAPGENVAAVADKAAQVIYIFPVDYALFFGAVQAYFATGLKAATPPTWPAMRAKGATIPVATLWASPVTPLLSGA